MFRRLWSGLPDTPKFPVNMEKLGYFINEDDEIRRIKDPRYYFKYFINKNIYYNDCQRFSFDRAVQKIIFERLALLGLQLVRLPLGAREDEPHVLTLVSNDLATADRVLLFVGETSQDLGILAHRVIGGAGGIDHGSVISMVRAIQDGGAPKHDENKNETTEENNKGEASEQKVKPPAIIIANPGELFWWPEARRSLSLPAVAGMPRPSAAHLAPRKYAQNTIPGHGDADEHIASLFKELLTCGVVGRDGKPGPMGNRTTTPRITAIGIAGGADALEGFLDHEERWKVWGSHMDSLVVLGGLYEERHIKTDVFRAFLRQRARAYIASEAPEGTPVSGPDGNEQAARSTRFGCPVHSAGTSWLTELMFIQARLSILAWGDMVARDPAYNNPQMEISYAETITKAEDMTWANFKGENGEDVYKQEFVTIKEPNWDEPLPDFPIKTGDEDGDGKDGGDKEDGVKGKEAEGKKEGEKENKCPAAPTVGETEARTNTDTAVDAIKDQVEKATLSEK